MHTPPNAHGLDVVEPRNRGAVVLSTCEPADLLMSSDPQQPLLPETPSHPEIIPPLVPIGARPSASTRLRRGGKMAKIKRSATSFRPGGAPAVTTSAVADKVKALNFLIPASGLLGTAEEITSIHEIATQLAAHSDVGAVARFGIREAMWEVSLELKTADSTDDDELLSEAFRALMPVIERLADLRNGFCRGKRSSWNFSIGTFIADQGDLS